MKKFKIQNVSGGILWALFAVSLVVLGLFFFGGEAAIEKRLVADTKLSEPAYTDALLYWIYALIVTTIAVTVLAFVLQFAAALKDSPVAALRSLLGVILLAGLMIVTYVLGDDTPLQLIGYTGSDNVAVWLKVGDMFIFSTTIMVVLMVVLMIGFGIRNRLKL